MCPFIHWFIQNIWTPTGRGSSLVVAFCDTFVAFVSSAFVSWFKVSWLHFPKTISTILNVEIWIRCRISNKVSVPKKYMLMWVIFMPDLRSVFTGRGTLMTMKRWLHPMWYCSTYLWGLQLSHLIDVYVLYMFYEMCEWFIHTLQDCRLLVNYLSV